jgi:aminoglycoside/choline kinase family phosphotransferase
MQRSECESVLGRAMHDRHDVQLVDFELRPLNGAIGFLGEHHLLNLSYQRIGCNNMNKCTFFFKRVPTNERHSNFVIDEGIFAKEREIYETIIPMFCKYLNVQKIPVPKCYFIKANEFMVLENLTEQDFTMHEKLVPLDFMHCKCALKALAVFHAGSIVTEFKTGKKIVEFVKYDHEVLLANDHKNSIARSWNVTSLETIFRMMQMSRQYDEKIGGDWKLVHNRLSEAWDKCIKMAAEPSGMFKNVLCHRDLWLNNIMFKYDADGHPSEATLVDFQIFRYCPPAIDLSMFMYLTTTRQFREQHLFSLLLTYHNELCMVLREAGLDPGEPHGLGLSEILASFEEYRFFGLVVAAR